ncbi:hypothetical protein Dsin_016227 [Dipteronia sinensis]|uniref:Uncharacterized protein n=1 Tax=Dipteronia sinensis TaxID=43782 RepID=A0AAE0E5A8_9ROSI|nr:hypothetical protein Dsin_016227 [Dipteronia sinensis]
MSRMNKELQSIKELITGKPGSSQGVGQVIGEIEGGEGHFSQEEQAQALGEFPRPPRNDPYSNTYNPGLRNHPNLSWSNNNHLGATNYQGGNTNFQGGNNNQGYQNRGYNRYNQGGANNNNQWGSSSSNPPSNFNSHTSASQPKDKSLEEIVSTVIKTVGIGSEALKNTLHASEQRMSAYMQSNDQRANSHGASLKKMETQLV